MNWKNTWILVGLAMALFAFIALFERHMTPSGYVTPPVPLFSGFNASEATTLHLRRGTQPTLTLERTNGGAWQFTKPFAYPAATVSVQHFLDALERVVPSTHITSAELTARKQTPADFGFDAPPLVLTLEANGARRELHFGARTPAGDQVYVEVVGTTGYFVVPSELLDTRLPRSLHEWRDTALFRFSDERLERAEVTQGGGPTGFVLALDATNKLWRLLRPAHRADQLQVRQLLDKLLAGRVVEFVADGAQIDAEAYGFQSPAFELTLTAGGAAQKVQFGRSPSNDATRVYARLLSFSNVVVVPKAYVDLLNTPPTELRDRQLISFTPDLIDIIEVDGEEDFTVRRNANGGWSTGDAAADPIYVAQWLGALSQLQVSDFVKDVVTDFAPYGLAPPQRRYTFRTVVTNANGPTNILVAQVDFGTNAATDRAFARRWDETSVYAIRFLEYTHMPAAAWQLRDHRVWTFTTNQLARITVTQSAKVREVLRQPNGEWVAVKGFDTELNPFAMEELALQLGDLNSVMWVARGEAARSQYGFTTNSARLEVELRGEKPGTLQIEFGGLSPLLRPYALTMLDGQPAVFEFPWTLFADLQRYFDLAPAGGRQRL